MSDQLFALINPISELFTVSPSTVRTPFSLSPVFTIVSINIFVILFTQFVYFYIIEKLATIDANTKSLIYFFILTVDTIFTLKIQEISNDGLQFNLTLLILMLAIIYSSHLYVLIGVFAVQAFLRYFMEEAYLFASLLEGITIIVIGLILITFGKTLLQRERSFYVWLIIVVMPTLTFAISHLNLLDILTTTEYALLLGIFLFIHWLIIMLTDAMRDKQIFYAKVGEIEKQQLVSGLAASIAHEIRNPLTMSKGFMQLIKIDLPSDHPHLSYVDQALIGIDKANEVITDFLTFARPEIERTHPTQITSFMKSVVSFINPYASYHGIDIYYKSHVNDDVYITCSEQRLTQCLINVMKNGIEAMDEGKKLSIIVQNERDYVVIEIIDEGCGMTTEQVDRLGTPFYTTKERGTGLGIMVVTSLLTAMNARFQVHSTLGKGTTFRILFPITEVAMPEQQTDSIETKHID
ncbi:MAG: ATP-binding protein [Bacilli bacterium]